MSEIYRLKGADFVKGLITAVFGAVIATVYGLFQTPDFNLFQADYASIGNDVVKVAISTFIAYLSKNLFTDSSGKVFGKI